MIGVLKSHGVKFIAIDIDKRKELSDFLKKEFSYDNIPILIVE